MAQTVKLKRSAVSGNTPTTSDLALGEIAINTYDGNIFIKKNDGTESIVTFSPGSNAGTIEEDSFSGNGSTTAFTLSTAPSSEEHLLVFIDATFQNRDSFTISGTTITFDTAPDNGSSVRVYHIIPGSVDDGVLTVAKFAADTLVLESEGISSNDNDTTIPTSAAVKDYVDTQITAEDLDITTDSGTIAIDLDSETLTISGGTGLDSSATGNAVTLAIDSTVTTLTGTQTLTNKTLTSPVINTGISGTAFLDDDTFATATATTLASSESIKAYVDTQVATVDTLPEVLANGNTTGGTDISVSTGDDITFADSSKAIFGAGSDLQIYHDGSNSLINESGVGGLIVRASNYVDIQPSGGGAYMGRFLSSGAVELYHNASKKFETTSTGIDVTGTVTATDLLIDTDVIVTDSTNDRVGINKTSPATTLDVAGSIYFSSILRGTSDGSASSPTIQPGNDGDTGLYRPAANQIGFTTAGTNALTIDASQNATFAGTINSGAITSTGEVEATALDINGNGDISGNLTLGGYLAGPATFTIDPAAVGDNTGTVVIAGNLQVDGTTTTINSTTLTVDDKRITLASGSLNAAAADGAGIEVEISGATYPSIKYDGTNDEWDFNKPINLTGDGHDLLINSADYELVLLGNRGSTGVNLDKAYLRMKAEGANTVVIDTAGNSYFNGGNVGIGTSSPLAPLDVVRGGTTGLSSVNARTALLVQNNLSSGTVLSINAKNTGYSGIFLGDQDNEAICQIQYVHTADKLKFLTNGGGYNPLTLSGTNVGVNNNAPSVVFQVEEYGIDTTETSTTATTQVAIHTFAATTFRSARFTIQVTNSTDSTYHLTEILMIHDGTTPSITEYGTIFTGAAAEATFDADINTGNVRLLATPASTDTMEFKVVSHSITT